MREQGNNINSQRKSSTSSQRKSANSKNVKKNPNRKTSSGKMSNGKSVNGKNSNSSNKGKSNIKSINAKKQKKYKRRQRFLGLIVAVGIILIIIFVHSYSAKTNQENLETYMNQGNQYVINGQYKEAIQSYDKVLNINKEDQKAKDLINILQIYLKAENDYNSGNKQAAIEALSELPKDYTRYPVGMEINGLKNQLQGSSQASSQTKDDLLTLNELYSNKQYKEALGVIQRLNKENLNSTQEVYVSEINASIEKKLGDSAQKTAFSESGKYLDELNNLTIKVNNTDLSAQTYEQKLQRAKTKYNMWNDELNKILQQLQNKLQPSKMEELQQSQTQWIGQKNASAVASEAKYSNPLVKQTANYQTQRDETSDRCYYLVNNYM